MLLVSCLLVYGVFAAGTDYGWLLAGAWQLGDAVAASVLPPCSRPVVQEHYADTSLQTIGK